MGSGRWMVDIRPLRESPPFRRLWVGSGVAGFGGRMANFAVLLQVFTLTHSSFAVGAVGLVLAIPKVGFGLFAGAIVDAFDRRTIVLLMTGVQVILAAGLTAQAFAHLDAVWPLYVLVGVQGMFGAVNGPAKRTFLRGLLPEHRVAAGATLNMLVMHGSVVAGPALAGVVAATWGLPGCYLLDVLGTAAMLYASVGLPAMPPEGGGTRPGARAVADGLRFIVANRILCGALLTDLSVCLLGIPVALLPAINAARFGGSPQTLGFLMAAPAVGGVLGSVFSGPVGRVARRGRAMLASAAVFGLGVAGFGFATSLWLALPLLAVSGAADMLCVVFRTSIVQVITPDEYRGRLSAAESVVGAGSPQLGNFRAGAVGSLTTPAVGVISGGTAAAVAVALIGVTLPALVRYRARTAEPEPA